MDAKKSITPSEMLNEMAREYVSRELMSDAYDEMNAEIRKMAQKGSL